MKEHEKSASALPDALFFDDLLPLVFTASFRWFRCEPPKLYAHQVSLPPRLALIRPL
jgi:hypothetical protein